MELPGIDAVGRASSRAANEVRAIHHMRRAGMFPLGSPAKTAQALGGLRRYGALGGAIVAAAARHPHSVWVADELGELTFGEMERRSNALANAWREVGAGPGTGIGILARNHRGFLDASLAAGKLGARVVFLNTDFAAPQLRDVAAREGVEILAYDEEFAAVVDAAEVSGNRFVAWAEGEQADPTLESLIAGGDPSPPPAPGDPAKAIMLTSGTTGTPKGAPREGGSSFAPIGALLSRVPFQANEATYVAPPLFHALGFAHAMLAIGLGSKVILRRRFEPEAVLAGVAEHRASALIVVPAMLMRILALPEEVRARHDTGCLRIVFCSGAQLDADLARRSLEAFGDTLYNMYGSTEVAYASFATPEDLRAAPGCAGRVPFGTEVRILDERGGEVPRGGVGRIFVGNGFQFEGYTGGGTKEVVGGLMSSGDVGHFDPDGRLWVDGRDDEMIVSGGENVFPREVEELLATHPDIHEAAAIGVDDADWGKRLRAFVALRPDGDLSESEIKEFVKANLARYKVPREVIFLDELPRNPTGKVLKRELAEMEPATEGSKP
jgi:acyl-CoA synthetase (AMP-forming)/AMP-acid ligase II